MVIERPRGLFLKPFCLILAKKMANKIIQYIKDSKTELKKVVWPTRKQAMNHTILVIGFSLGVAAFLGLVDFLLNKLLELII